MCTSRYFWDADLGFRELVVESGKNEYIQITIKQGVVSITKMHFRDSEEEHGMFWERIHRGHNNVNWVTLNSHIDSQDLEEGVICIQWTEWVEVVKVERTWIVRDLWAKLRDCGRISSSWLITSFFHYGRSSLARVKVGCRLEAGGLVKILLQWSPQGTKRND